MIHLLTMIYDLLEIESQILRIGRLNFLDFKRVYYYKSIDK